MPIDIPVAQRTTDIDHAALIEQNTILRNANQNLMMATFGAEDLRDQAESAHRHQNEFLAMLAHELRNPLAPIGLASAMLANLPIQSSQLLHIKSIIDRQVGQLSHLLNDLLDAARISNGKIELHRQALLVADQLTNALETVQARLIERRQQLILELPDQAVWIDGDAIRLAQVFSNLLINASKFTPDGGRIVLRARVLVDAVIITVEDNGVGISADVLPTLFELFSQGPTTLARSDGGLGVGLSIVRNVLELHGGSVNVTSPGLGLGSTFTVSLPLLDVVDNQAETLLMDAQPAMSHHILLVEDSVDVSTVLGMILRSENHTVTVALDGITGLALACAGGFDVILCDIGLPSLNGYDLVRKLRATTGTGKGAPVCVAVSGYGELEDRARALAAGFDHYMVKPINVENLLQLIASVPHGTSQDRQLSAF